MGDGKLQSLLLADDVVLMAAEPPFTWRFGDKEIEQVEHYKYLGVWISHNLSWGYHIERIVEKAKSRTKQLIPLMVNRKIPIKARHSAWKAIVLPVLSYGSEVWEGNTKDADKVEVVMN